MTGTAVSSRMLNKKVVFNVKKCAMNSSFALKY